MRGSDFLQLDATTAPRRGLADWLQRSIRDGVFDGRLPAHSPLPSTRRLAGELGIARGVVVEAYARLVDEGLIVSVKRSGFAVAGGLGGRDPLQTTRPASRVDVPVEFDLTPGRPDLSSFPRSEWLSAERTVLAQSAASELGYGDPRGAVRLRHSLAWWLASARGVRTEPERIIVVSGVAQALALIAQVAVRRGESRIAVEDPGSHGAHTELAYWGATLRPVPVDSDGLLAAELTGHDDLALVTPAHEFPLGVVLAPDRRAELLRWAHEYRAVIIEDDYDAEHRFDRAPVPALQASAPDQVLYAGSTSKALAPAMRLGWLIAPRSWLDDLTEAKYASDLGSPTLPQLVLAELIESGRYTKHLRVVRTSLRARRDAAVSAIARHLPAARVGGIAAGLHLVVTASDIDDVRWAETARNLGVIVQPLSMHRHTPGAPGLVLGYATTTPGRLDEAVRRIAAACDSGR
ncbi:aminotransferase class I/II-fold pyridoxal phosphate-dependent enzyme [Epidermidibacterium keratini]|uniref:Aminotransferase class I/II-fold pyridoxal phosphate-dependent enzyme n=1 Tax=Epidermidibacterium keratini TaxID=1891644 RepID=A0A7L4YVC3_9ACTN|nr:PLP-dependent aminotransferase family protein [Epidermidibacterium keratini]QHC02197.1 aminotransferase class I/II-fold pyridoxal phosphate-dependent enzyme [Epidermidibacterium keratini]